MWLFFPYSTETFSPKLLNNFPGLMRYMEGDGDIEKIKKLSEQSEKIFVPTEVNPYFGRWQVCSITVKYAFNSLISTGFAIVSFVLNKLWLQHAATYFSIQSEHAMRDWMQLSDQYSLEETVLVPAFNLPKSEAWDVYCKEPQSISSITDPDVLPYTPKEAFVAEGIFLSMERFYHELDKSRANQGYLLWLGRKISSVIFPRSKETESFRDSYKKNPDRAFNNLKRKYYYWDDLEKPLATLYQSLNQTKKTAETFQSIDFHYPQGHCRGASYWFIKLFFNSAKNFTDPLKHGIAVAKQFEKGISGQGIVLQSLMDPAPLLKLDMQKMPKHNIYTYELDKEPHSAQKKFEALPDGVYRVGIRHHSVVFVKQSSSKSLLWDPKKGLFSMSDERAYQFLTKHYHRPEDPESFIAFEKYKPAILPPSS